MGILTSLPTCTVEDGLYAIEDVPGKGKGLIATKDISKGTRIISEKPAITVGGRIASMEQLEAAICQQVSSLSTDQIRDFCSMDNVYPYTDFKERWRGIFQTNALPTGSNLDAGGVFFQACRINHACNSNSTNFWNDRLSKLTIQAIRDIGKGEEITISYLRSHRDRQMRREELQKNFKFTCLCELCSLPRSQRRKSNMKLNRIHKIDCIIEEGGVPGLVLNPRQMLSYIDEQVRLWNEPIPNDIGLARTYPDAFEVAIANGDLARACVFAERLVPLYVTTMGADSPDVMQYKKLIRNPTTHQYYGLSMNWSTTLDEIPRGLGPKEFEDWLWKR